MIAPGQVFFPILLFLLFRRLVCLLIFHRQSFFVISCFRAFNLCIYFSSRKTFTPSLLICRRQFRAPKQAPGSAYKLNTFVLNLRFLCSSWVLLLTTHIVPMSIPTDIPTSGSSFLSTRSKPRRTISSFPLSMEQKNSWWMPSLQLHSAEMTSILALGWILWKLVLTALEVWVRISIHFFLTFLPLDHTQSIPWDSTK